MKRNHVIAVVLIVAVAVLAAVLVMRKSDAPKPQAATSVVPAPTLIPRATPTAAVPATSPSPQIALPPEVAAKLSEPDKVNIGKILEAFGAPIEFYGKVIDDRGAPVDGATIYYSVADQYFGDSSKYTGTSDSDGSFTISGVKGAGVYVEVSKEGYYRVTEKSYASFGYGVPSGRQPPSKDNPAIFVLRKKGIAEPLVYVSSRQYKVPRDGTPFEIDLRTGRQAGAGAGDVKVERWVSDQNKDAAGRFDWKCRISVPGGGLIEKTELFDFDAPENGYTEAVEIDMPKTLGSNWQRTKRVEYFLKLRDGPFARVVLTMHAGHNNFLVMESFVNPSGSRHMEYDPSKQASAR